MLLFKGFFVSLQSTRGLVSSNNFYYCRYYNGVQEGIGG